MRPGESVILREHELRAGEPAASVFAAILGNKFADESHARVEVHAGAKSAVPEHGFHNCDVDYADHAEQATSGKYFAPDDAPRDSILGKFTFEIFIATFF